MGEPHFQISRNGEALGVLPLSEIRTLLEAAFLLPTDGFRSPGQANWQPLSALHPAAKEQTDSLAARIRVAVAKATKPAARLARRASAKASELAQGPQSVARAASDKVLGAYLPRLREQTAERLATLRRTADSALRDEVFLRKLFGAVYDCLPKPVYRFVGEEQFIMYCLNNRQRLLGHSQPRSQSTEAQP